MTEITSLATTPISPSDSPGDILDFSRQAGYAATIQFGRLHRMDPRGKEQELIRQVEESVDLIRQTCTIATALNMHGLLEKYHANEAVLRDQEETARDVRRKKLAGGQSDFIIRPVHTYRPSHQMSRSFSSNGSRAGVGENKMSIELQHQIEAIIRARSSTVLVKGETLSHTDYLSDVDKEELERIRSVVAQSVVEAKTMHQTRLEALAEDNTLKGKVKQTAERVDEMLAPYSDQELLKKAAGAYERRKNNREAADPVNAPSWHDSLPDTTAPHHPPSHNQHTGTQPYSGQEVRNEITDRGAQDWLVRFRTQVVNLPEDELPGYAREQLSGVERDLEEIPQGDTATREAYIIARAQVEKSLAEQGWDVHGPEWQGASASTVSENYHVDAPQIVDPDAKVIKIENVGVYSKDPTKPEYSAIVMFRNPDGKVIYATIKDKNRAPSSRAMPPAHPFPSNPPSRVAHVINNASQRVQSATSTARGYVDRLTDIPGAPGVATGARQAARVATDALGDLTARFRRPSVGQQRAPIPEPHPKSVQNPVPDANPPIAPKPPETQPPDPIVEARKRYQQARVDFVGWARDDTNLRVLESYFRRLANIKNNKDTQIFVLANIPHIGILNPGESDNSGMFLINRTLGYLRFLDQQKVELNLAGEQLEAVNRIGRLLVDQVGTLTDGHFLLPSENSTASPNRMSLDSCDELIRLGYQVEII